MALAASVRSSRSTLAALKPVRMTFNSVASLVKSKQLSPIFSMYAHDLDSQSDGGILGLAFLISPPHQFRSRVARFCAGRVTLTDREREVLEMLVVGRSNKEIGGTLGIEERTVKAHVAKLLRKVGVQNRIALSVYAITHSLVSPPKPN